MLKIVSIAVAVLLVLLAGRFAYLSMTARPPKHLGAQNGRLAPCPDSPNCVSSQAERESQRVEALRVPEPADAALAKVIRAIETMPGSRVVTSDGGYVHAEFTSRLFRFVDDLELLYDGEVPGFQVRSESRIGHSDMGANRKRVERLRRLVVR